MSRRREEMLRELGLTPVWRLRPAADEVTAVDEAPPAAEAPSVFRSMRDPDARSAPPPVTRHSSPVTKEKAPVTSDSEPGERREQILRLPWPELKARAASCTDCPLHAKRNKVVFGVGDENADWLFVGEGPGADEDAQGEPFVGQAGKLLDNMLAAIKIRRGENVYIANIVKCLRYNALVKLGDGRWERIGRLVASKYSGEVMSLDGNGVLVRRRVVGWHATPLAGRPVFRLSYESVKSAGASKSSIQLTGDHPVLTERGWIAVQDLRKGDRIATGQGLSETAFDVVIGTLLGDGYIHPNNAYLSVSHSERQSEYLQFKAQLLSELNCHVESLTVTARVGDARRYPIARMRTRAHRALSIIRSQFYGPKKRVPSWIETRLNERMLAFWFMDDGYTRIRKNRRPRAEIATCGFADDDIQKLLKGLAKLGLFAKALRGRIHFGVEETRKLSQMIAPFTPPSMRYKLHPDVAKEIPFDSRRLDVGDIKALYDDVVAEEIVHHGTDKTFYCLDIEETHNFVTSGGVVHNCRPPGNRNPEATEAGACEPYLARQIALIQPKLIIALGKVAALNLLAREASIASLRGKVHRYGEIPLIVTYHPAYLLRSLHDKAKAWEDLCFAVRTMADLEKV